MNSNREFHIALDARFLREKYSGIGAHIKGLLTGFSKVEFSSGLKFTLFGPPFAQRFLPKKENFQFLECSIPPLRLKEHWEIPRLLRDRNISLFHVPHFNAPFLWRGKLIVTIHDLTPLRFPQQYSPAARAYFQIMVRRASRRAEAVFAVSRFTAQSLIEMGIPGEKIRVIYNGVEPPPEAPPERERTFLEKYNLRDYLLYCGNVRFHKNVALLVRLIRELQKSFPSLKLVIAGAVDPDYQEFKLELSKTDPELVLLLGYVSPEGLSTLYKNALLFLFPSLSEGFGIPPLEAMSYGLPVVASHCASIPEVLGDAALLLPPDDLDAWVEGVKSILVNSSFCESLKEKGLQRWKMFSWENTARSMLKEYERLK
ncbi:MAG: glycosyltransferase family 1 protein [Coprothermobacterota bacterium]|nr:glycosyltransferase family 1 protein [Coprothermobacterota bacterium]